MNVLDSITHIKNKNQENSFLVYLDGVLAQQLSDLHLLPKELIVENGLDLRLTKNTAVKQPLHRIFVQTKLTTLSLRVQAEEGSELTLIDEYISADAVNYATHVSMEVVAHKNARIYHHKIQNEDHSVTHLSHMHIKQAKDSDVRHFSFTQGGQKSREDVKVEQSEPGSHCQLYGLYQLSRDNQQLDHNLCVDHLAQQGHSKMLYKGILDKKSRASFTGKVHVHANAQKINAYQANHHILLSDYAEAVSKPELEIYADDIKCTHGSTAGQLDQEALFFLRSRGIDDQTAKRMLLNAFAEEVISFIENKSISQYIRGFI